MILYVFKYLQMNIQVVDLDKVIGAEYLWFE